MGVHDTIVKRLIGKIENDNEGVINYEELKKQANFYTYTMGTDLVKSETNKIYLNNQLVDCDLSLAAYLFAYLDLKWNYHNNTDDQIIDKFSEDQHLEDWAFLDY